MNKHGFSLIEMLIVIAIIGIIGGVSAPTFIRARDRALVGEVSAQLAADLERARSSSRRSNQDARVSWAASGKKYTVTFAGVTTERTIPAGVVVTLPGALLVEYKAPFGELKTASNLEFTLTSKSRSDVYEKVKVLGVTGKVYRQ